MMEHLQPTERWLRHRAPGRGRETRSVTPAGPMGAPKQPRKAHFLKTDTINHSRQDAVSVYAQKRVGEQGRAEAGRDKKGLEDRQTYLIS